MNGAELLEHKGPKTLANTPLDLREHLELLDLLPGESEDEDDGRVTVSRHIADDSFGKFATPGSEIIFLKDREKTDGFYFYDFATDEQEDHGVPHTSFGRAYVDAETNEHNLGKTHIIDLMRQESFPALKQMMEAVGFKNVELKVQPLSIEKGYMNCVVVAEN